MTLTSSQVLVENLTPGSMYTFVLSAISGDGVFDTESLSQNVTAGKDEVQFDAIHLEVLPSLEFHTSEAKRSVFYRKFQYTSNYEVGKQITAWHLKSVHSMRLIVLK